MSELEKIKEMAKDLKSLDDISYYPNCNHIYRRAEKLKSLGYIKQEWISVEDRLPEKDVRVLVYLETDRSYTKIDTDRLDDRGFVRWYKDVTHWMPLPEPPETKGESEL